MHCTISGLINVICLLLHHNHALLTHNITGSLSSTWTMNFTVYMEHFEKAILSALDYERNFLSLSASKTTDGENTIFILYNKNNRHVYIKSLCGCNPCHGMRMNFEIRAWLDAIALKCNNIGMFILKKEDTKNRVNDDLTDSIKKLINKPNQIYIMILIDTPGCLDSFNYNDQPLQFEADQLTFKRTCPRKCVKDQCYAGMCRALYSSGPSCDCSSTALNGPSCSKRLGMYDRSNIHSYQVQDVDDSVYFKLSWKTYSMKRYCLLEFAHQYGYVTYHIDQHYLLKGNDMISTIDPQQNNFINVYITKHELILKVNNNVTTKLILFGQIRVNIGFTMTKENCQTFEGQHDFNFNPSHLHSAVQQNVEDNDKSDHKLVITISVFVVIVTVLVVAVVSVVIYYRRVNQRREPIATENKYEFSYRAHNNPIKVPSSHEYAKPRDSMNSMYSFPDDRTTSYLPALPPRP